MNAANRSKPHSAPGAVVIDMHARELRLGDFKSAYAQAFTECLEAEDRVLESLHELRALERSLMLNVDAVSQDLVRNSRSLTQQHDAIRADIARASTVLTGAASVIQGMRASLLGPKGVIGQTHEALLGAHDADGKLVKQGTVHLVHAALVTGEGSVAGRMSARLEQMSSTLDKTLNGESGVGARFDKRVSKSANEVMTAAKKAAAALHEARAVQQNWILLSASAAGVLASGILVGAAIARALMR